MDCSENIRDNFDANGKPLMNSEKVEFNLREKVYWSLGFYNPCVVIALKTRDNSKA